MLATPNALQWAGESGRYEVYYLTVTDPASGVGIWLRFSLLAPRPGGGAATAALWLLAMDPRAGRAPVFGRKHTFGIEALHAQADPFRLAIDTAVLTDHGTSGAFEDVEWELRWQPGERAYEHVDPILRRAAIAKTVLVLPHADLEIDGTIRLAGERLALTRARGGQAHLWGSKHASSWAWVHCNDFFTAEGRPVPGAFVDGVSVRVPRAGREVGPNTPVVGCIDGRDFQSTSPLRVLTNPSTFALTGWRFEAVDGKRKLIGQVDAQRSELAGVTYHDPDGERAYCYNTEVASMRLHVLERTRGTGGWSHRTTLTAPGRAHFEYAQRSPVPGLELVTS
jgi:hypothetical protein